MGWRCGDTVYQHRPHIDRDMPFVAEPEFGLPFASKPRFWIGAILFYVLIIECLFPVCQRFVTLLPSRLFGLDVASANRNVFFSSPFSSALRLIALNNTPIRFVPIAFRNRPKKR